MSRQDEKSGAGAAWLALIFLFLTAPPVPPAVAQSPGLCPAIHDPVCARKKDQLLDFSNACLAGLERATVLAKGRCPQGCPMTYKPVCAEDAPNLGFTRDWQFKVTQVGFTRLACACEETTATPAPRKRTAPRSSATGGAS